MPEIWPENWSGQKLAQQTADGNLRLFFWAVGQNFWSGHDPTDPTGSAGPVLYVSQSDFCMEVGRLGPFALSVVRK